MAQSQNTWACCCKAPICSLVRAQLQQQIQLALSSALNLQWVQFSGLSGFASTHSCTQQRPQSLAGKGPARVHASALLLQMWLLIRILLMTQGERSPSVCAAVR